MANDAPSVEIFFSQRTREVVKAPEIIGPQLGNLGEKVRFLTDGDNPRAVVTGDAGDRAVREFVSVVTSLLSGPYHVGKTNYVGNHSFGQP